MTRPAGVRARLEPPCPDGVLQGLREAAARLESRDVPVPALEGKLIRPLVSLGLVPPALRASLDGRFWSGALAVQMVHEASLLHDDIVDGARERRGSRTLAAEEGVAAALVRGDHFLTASYRAAAAAELPAFLLAFIESVERTVAGETEQGRRAGGRVGPERYEEIVRAKSGALFGAGAVLGGAFLDRPGELEARRELGCRLGALYQMVDDLLDYCPGAEVGKPPLQDYRQGKWTWILEEAEVEGFEQPEEEVVARLFHRRASGPSPAGRALERLEERSVRLLGEVEDLSPGDTVVPGVVRGWLRAASLGVRREEERRRGHAAPRPRLEAV